MGRICYEAIISCFNAEEESRGGPNARPDLIPDNDQLELLDEACIQVLKDDDIGFQEKIFGYQTRVSQSVFIQSLLKDNYSFMEPHSIRLMVQQQLTELTAQHLEMQ